MAYYVLAKYGEISHMTTFRTELADLKRGERVILRSDRGTELGTIVNPSFESEQPPEGGVQGEILRRITREDLGRIRQIEETDKTAEMKFCKACITSHDLPMKLVDVEHIFGGEKIIFYFLAEGRVDFRQLVKDLAKEYRTRIELKQIGVRDEARLLADYDHCGREICCRSFIRDLQPVTMRMAKAQKATLDPTKISGRCGRLMCCLRYEDKVYDEMKKQLPRKGATVVTERGEAEVIDYDIISQTLRVETKDGHIIKVLMKEVKKVIPRDEKEYQKRQQERAQQRTQQPTDATEQKRAGSRSRRGRGRQRGGRSGQGPGGSGNGGAPTGPVDTPQVGRDSSGDPDDTSGPPPDTSGNSSQHEG